MLQSKRGVKSKFVVNGVDTGIYCYPRLLPIKSSVRQDKGVFADPLHSLGSQKQVSSNQLSPTTLALLSPSPSNASSEDSILANSETKSDPYNSLQDTDSDEGTEGNESH